MSNPNDALLTNLLLEDENIPLQNFILNLFLSQKLILQLAEQIVHRHRFTTLEFDVLATLWRMQKNQQPQMKPSDIYKNLCVSSGGITKVLKSLEVAQLISRQADITDKRSHWVSLTPKGQTICTEILDEIHQMHLETLMPELTEAELQQATETLSKIVGHLNK